MQARFFKKHRRALELVALAIGGIVIALFVLSYFINPIIRSRLQSTMNKNLVGYHTEVAGAHLQLLTGTLSLYGIKIIQNAHPDPPVADIKELKLNIDMGALASRRLVATLTIYYPKLHIDLAQLQTERTNHVSIKKEGWQQAVEAIYPFKINRFEVIEGTATYIDHDPQRPLNLTHLNLVAQNIRNIQSPRATYPSPIHLETIAFDKGKIEIDGNANFLAEPFVGIKTRYWVSNLPFSNFEPVAQHANLHVSGGILDSKGLVEYSPQVRHIEVYNATIDRLNIDYFHRASTVRAEVQRVHEVKTAAKQVNNQPNLLLKVDEAEIKDSEVAYTDEAKKPNYKLFISDLDLKVTNFSNQAEQGHATLDLTGKFMDSGETRMTGTFRPEPAGPDFTGNLAIHQTDITTLNNLLEAYGRLRVAQGEFALYTQMTSNEGHVNGYVKPLFSELKVYDYQKDKNKPILKQAYKLAVGAVADLFKNRSTEKVATQTNVSGNINQPNVNTWQALGQLVENAFIKSILPGFDRTLNAGKPDGAS